jgi:hypothetical protein
MSSSRDRLADIIRPLLPEGWRDIETHTVKSIPNLSKPKVYIDFTAIGTAWNNQPVPAGAMIDSFEIALVSHLTDYSMAEDALDPAARAFLRKLDPLEEISWTNADKRALGDQRYLGWVVTVQLITTEQQE